MPGHSPGQGSPRIIAGKRADTIRGSNVFLAACRRPTRVPTASRLSLGRTPLRDRVLRTRPVRHSFQDANYHDQIVKERHGPHAPLYAARPARVLSWTEVRSGQRRKHAFLRPNRASTHGSITTSRPAGTDPEHNGIGRSTTGKLPARPEAVKHPENRPGKTRPRSSRAALATGCEAFVRCRRVGKASRPVQDGSKAGQEAPVGVEPTMADLQSAALATWLRSRESHRLKRYGKSGGVVKRPAAG